MDTRTPRNLAEVERSPSEANRVVLEPLDRAEIERYLAPAADTPFALEYAYYLLGDARGRVVVDLGCGSGENVAVLAERGSQVVGMDISPDLIAIAQQRMRSANLSATVRLGDAYNTGLPDESVDVIFCMALIHHLDIKVVRGEMWRILHKGGMVVLKEPIRFSAFYARLRSMLPAHEDISEYEHPLTREELSLMTQPFRVDGTRYFRLPFVPLLSRLLSSLSRAAWKTSDWIIRHFPPAEAYATAVVTRLQK